MATNGDGEFVGFKQVYFDLESTDLHARMGVLLVGSFMSPEGKIETIVSKKKDVLDDHELAVAIRDKLETYDIIMGWNSKEHDVRFLNARLSFWGERRLSPDLFHVDLMWQFAKLKVGGRSLKGASNFYGDIEQKLELPIEVWKRANIGDRKAIAELIDRCESDARITRELAKRVIPLVRRIGV